MNRQRDLFRLNFAVHDFYVPEDVLQYFAPKSDGWKNKILLSKVKTFILFTNTVFDTEAQGCCRNHSMTFLHGHRPGAPRLSRKAVRNSHASYFRGYSFICGPGHECGRGNTVQCDCCERSILSWEPPSRPSVLTHCHKWCHLSSAKENTPNPHGTTLAQGITCLQSYWVVTKYKPMCKWKIAR